MIRFANEVLKMFFVLVLLTGGILFAMYQFGLIRIIPGN